jgi:tRNA/rRNA methyltransferase
MEERADTVLDNFHVILVEPAYGLNIGATARAMMNLGFRHLHLVAPKNYDPERARSTALAAEPILKAMRFHDTFMEAIGEMEEVVGLAFRRGRNPSNFVTLTEWTEQLATRASRKTALVFGPEDNGLRQEHLNYCRWIVRIPSSTAFDSFNLAQSVLLVLYEITKALPDAAALTAPREIRRSPTVNDYVQLDRLLEGVMQGSGFIPSDTPPPDAVRNLFGRLDLTTQEIGILLSLFGRINLALHPKE